jgi:hypothetical protein
MATNSNYGGYQTNQQQNNAILQQQSYPINTQPQFQQSDGYNTFHTQQYPQTTQQYPQTTQSLPLIPPAKPVDHRITAGIFSSFLCLTPLVIVLSPQYLGPPFGLIFLVNFFCAFKAIQIHCRKNTENYLKNSAWSQAIWITTGIVNAIVSLLLLCFYCYLFIAVVSPHNYSTGLAIAAGCSFSCAIWFGFGAWFCYDAFHFAPKQLKLQEELKQQEQQAQIAVINDGPSQF